VVVVVRNIVAAILRLVTWFGRLGISQSQAAADQGQLGIEPALEGEWRGWLLLLEVRNVKMRIEVEQSKGAQCANPKLPESDSIR
jgi:cellobiose phosphorylase